MYLISAICLIQWIWRNFDSAYRSIYADTTIDVNDADEIRRRAERIFTSSTYKKQVERSKKNWLDLSVDEVLKKDLAFLYKI